MRFDIVALARRAGSTRTTDYIMPRIVPTVAQEQDLAAIYFRVVNLWAAAWRRDIRPEYTRTLDGLPMIGDSVASTQAVIMRMDSLLLRMLVGMVGDVDSWITDLEVWHRRQFAQNLRPTGVNIFTLLDRREVQTTLQAVLFENASLIRSLEDQMRNDISGAVMRGFNNRTPALEVAKEIEKIEGIGRRRALLIASDQTRKLSGALDEERQRQAGIDSFRWHHSRKRYPRIEHVERDGKIYEWDSAVGRDDPPGYAINCGCAAEGVVAFSKWEDRIRAEVDAAILAETLAATP